MFLADINKRIKDATKNHRVLLENFSWLASVEVIMLLTPLITYPYIVWAIGMELYGYVISAQALMAYAQLIIDFGSNAVCAKHVSINRDDTQKLSEIVCSVFWVRALLWVICLVVYMSIVYLIPAYREWGLLFFLTYFMALNDVLYPRYFFQGIEDMRFISIVSILTKLLFIILMFVVVRNETDYLWIPILYAIGFSLGGVVSLWIIFKKMKILFFIPKWNQIKGYVVESLPIFSTSLISSIKDKLNYQLLGIHIGMSQVVIYDLGFKLNSLISKPTDILITVLFPKFARNRDINKLKKTIVLNFVCCSMLVLLLNVFLPWIVSFFLHTNDVDLLPIRLISLFPVILSISGMISQNYFVAFGYNKYVLYSIIITTSSYLVILGIMIFTKNMGSIYSFVFLAMASYIIELLYRLYVFISKEKNVIK